MGTELRKKKSKSALETGDAKSAAKRVPKAEKRKAVEDASPVPVKKQKAKAKAVETAATTPAADEKKTKKKTSKSKDKVAEKPEPEETADKDEEDGAFPSEDEEANDTTMALAKMVDSDGEEDDAEDAMDPKTFKSGQDVGKIPKPKKATKTLRGPKEEPGVVYVGRLPHGFAENELRGYFSQFGPVNKVRVSRNKKTGASKHYAFLEFAEASTAEVVEKTMDNYLLFNHILRVRVVPPEQLKDMPNLWKGANRRFKIVPSNRLAGRHLAQPAGVTTWESRRVKEETRRSTRAAKLKDIGYEFDAPKLIAAEAVPKTIVIDNGEEEVPKATEAAPEAEQGDGVEDEQATTEPKKTKAKGKKKKSDKKEKAKIKA